jgi:hypothetical protein
LQLPRMWAKIHRYNPPGLYPYEKDL